MSKFDPVAECAAGGQDRIGKAQRANVYSEVYRGWRCHFKNSSMSSGPPVWKGCGKTAEIRIRRITRASRRAISMLRCSANAHR
jgi:hypothetical protein